MNLNDKFKKEIRPVLTREFSIKNPLAVPKLEKIVVNIGLGEANLNRKILNTVSAELALITGQKPIITRARRAIATFKLVAGDPIGLKVTLRGARMYAFMQKIITVVLPRVRDFRGVDPKSFDGRGNYSIGFSEQIIFPEIEYGKLDKVRGLEVTITTTSSTNEQGKRLLELMGLPFKK